MLFIPFFCAFIYLFSPTDAYNISFPTTPIAAQNSTFSWIRDANDRFPFFLRKQKLDDPGGVTPFSYPVPILGADGAAGQGQMYFNRAGLFSVGVFLDQNQKNPSTSFIVTVNVNPTSAGLPSIPTATSMTRGNGTDPQVMMNNNGDGDGDDRGHGHGHGEGGGDDGGGGGKDSQGDDHQPDISLIVGAVIGSVGLIFLVTATFLWFRYRTRRQRQRDVLQRRMTVESDDSHSDSARPILQPSFPRSHTVRSSDSTSLQNLTLTRPLSTLQMDALNSLPPAPDVRSIASSGSFSITSPIVARTRDAARHMNNNLNNFRLSMSTTSQSTSSRRSGAASGTTSSISFPVPPLPPRTRTDRQKLLEEKIQLMQARMIFLQGRKPHMPDAEAKQADEELKLLEKKVERAKQLHESDWALGLTNIAPEGLHD